MTLNGSTRKPAAALEEINRNCLLDVRNVHPLFNRMVICKLSTEHVKLTANVSSDCPGKRKSENEVLTDAVVIHICVVILEVASTD